VKNTDKDDEESEDTFEAEDPIKEEDEEV